MLIIMERLINILCFWEERTTKGETVQTESHWLTSIRITEKCIKNNRNRTETMENRAWRIQPTEVLVGEVPHAYSHNKAVEYLIFTDFYLNICYNICSFF